MLTSLSQRKSKHQCFIREKSVHIFWDLKRGSVFHRHVLCSLWDSVTRFCFVPTFLGDAITTRKYCYPIGISVFVEYTLYVYIESEGKKHNYGSRCGTATQIKLHSVHHTSNTHS